MVCEKVIGVHIRLRSVVRLWIGVVVNDGEGTVDRTFLGVCVRCPLDVSGENGRCLQMISGVRNKVM